MRQKLLIITLSICVGGIITSCHKEIKYDDTPLSEKKQKKTFDAEEIKVSVLKYRDIVEKIDPQIKESISILTQKIETFKLERSKKFSNTGLLKRGNHNRNIINVPADYPTLQEAVDNAPQNGKIVVKGTVSDIGNVFVDVPGLTLQGEGRSPLISGNILMITAANITIQNLNINMVTAISGTNNVKLINNDIATPDGVREEGLLFLLNATNNTIKNCTVNGAYTGGLYRYGVFMNEGSTNNSIENCISKNIFSTSNDQSGSAFLINGENNSIKNCRALNFTRGFYSSAGKNNKFIGCIANNSTNDAGFVFFGTDETNLTLENCTASNNKAVGFFIFGASCKVSKCSGNSNGSYGLQAILANFMIEKNTFSKNNKAGIVLYDVESGLHKGTLEKNEIEFNKDFGIYMWGMNNSTITRNKSKNNTVCDFNQKDCSGNILTGNQFGTSCTGL